MPREIGSPEAARGELRQARARLRTLKACLWLAGAPGAGLAGAGAVVLAGDAMAWLTHGAWASVPLAVLAPYLPDAVGAWLAAPRSWPGFPQAALWSLGIIPLWLFLVAAGVLLFIALWGPLADAARRERNRVEWLEVRARRPPAGQGGRP
jgi:hypothetical protein